MTAPIQANHRSEATEALELAAWCRRRIVQMRHYPATKNDAYSCWLYIIQLAHQHIIAAPPLPR